MLAILDQHRKGTNVVPHCLEHVSWLCVQATSSNGVVFLDVLLCKPVSSQLVKVGIPEVRSMPYWTSFVFSEQELLITNYR